ncbi:hypothetical protein [Sinomonas humi]|uniref:Uncharacterized protein n=1 Tax=Sinomonas humi TaxID=1338436 RepID=A0A0B2AMY2_9MICC|nr:hypothetical protein [Sinomonas humi]KHL03214.1 hypothetical protein LK10_09595 [Sinomonas humi]
MIHLPGGRTKGCAVLGASAPGQEGPFGLWEEEPDEDERDPIPDPSGRGWPDESAGPESADWSRK